MLGDAHHASTCARANWRCAWLLPGSLRSSRCAGHRTRTSGTTLMMRHATTAMACKSTIRHCLPQCRYFVLVNFAPTSPTSHPTPHACIQRQHAPDLHRRNWLAVQVNPCKWTRQWTRGAWDWEREKKSSVQEVTMTTNQGATEGRGGWPIVTSLCPRNCSCVQWCPYTHTGERVAPCLRHVYLCTRCVWCHWLSNGEGTRVFVIKEKTTVKKSGYI